MPRNCSKGGDYYYLVKDFWRCHMSMVKLFEDIPFKCWHSYLSYLDQELNRQPQEKSESRSTSNTNNLKNRNDIYDTFVRNSVLNSHS